MLPCVNDGGMVNSDDAIQRKVAMPLGGCVGGCRLRGEYNAFQ